MLSWYDPLYVDKTLKDREKGIRQRLNEGKVDLGHYLITLAGNGRDHLDVISTSFLSQRALYERLPMVVGLAATKKEAMKLVVKICRDCLEETGGADIRSYLLRKGNWHGNSSECAHDYR